MRKDLPNNVLHFTSNGQQLQRCLGESLPTEWRTWVAERKLMGWSDASIIVALEKKGFHNRFTRSELESLKSQPIFNPALRHAKQQLKACAWSKVKVQLARLSKDADKVEIRKSISPLELLNQYYAKNRPVLLTHLIKKWPSLKRWEPSYLKKKIGHVIVEIMSHRNSNPNYEKEPHKHMEQVRFAEFVDKTLQEATDDYYLVSQNEFFSNPETRILLKDVEALPGQDYRRLYEASFWMGPKGTITKLHFDVRNIYFAQIRGSKRVQLISPMETHLLYNEHGPFSPCDPANPDYEKFPLLRDAEILELTIHAGEVLFIPVGWWHRVEALEPSISMSFPNFIFTNDFPGIHSERFNY